MFVGAGGGALPLLQKAGIKEVKGFGGFPVGGQWLRTGNPVLTAAHQAKVYGLPPLGAPPMSVPHLDTRVINGKSWLLFGPFAGWSPKFLKQGKVTDLPLSVKPQQPGLDGRRGAHQMGLVKYLIGQLLRQRVARVDALREFAPSAVDSDWELDVAGQRVQVIRRPRARAACWSSAPPCSGGRRQHRRPARCLAGRLDRRAGHVRRHAALLRRPYQGSWLPKLKEMVPSLGIKLSENPALFDEVWARGTKVLGLESRRDAGARPSRSGADAPSPAADSDDAEPAGVV